MAAIGSAISKVDYSPRDYIELRMRKRERFTLLSKEGPFWFIARNCSGEEGYIPSAHVIADERGPVDLAYKTWKERCDTLLAKGAISIHDWAALEVPRAAAFCANRGCQAWKKSDDTSTDSASTFIACEHELEQFLKAEPSYGAEWLKAERLRWHPDWFAGRCKPDAREKLSKKASTMFTTISKLYEAETAKASQAKAPTTTEEVPAPTRNDTDTASASEVLRSDLPTRRTKHSGKLDPSAPSFTSAGLNTTANEGPHVATNASVLSASLSGCLDSLSGYVANENSREPEAPDDEIETGEEKGALPCSFTDARSPLQNPVTPATTAPLKDSETTPSPHQFNPSAPSFRPLIPVKWHPNVSKTGSSSTPNAPPRTASPVKTLDLQIATAGQAATWHASCAPDTQVTDYELPFAAGTKTNHDGYTETEFEMDTEEQQLMLVKARNARAKMKVMGLVSDGAAAAREPRTNRPGDHPTQPQTDHDVRKTRERWCRPQPLDDRVAQQAKREANAARLRATVESRRKARADQRNPTILAWRATLTDSHEVSHGPLDASSSDKASISGSDESESDGWKRSQPRYARSNMQGQTTGWSRGENGWWPASGPPSACSHLGSTVEGQADQ